MQNNPFSDFVSGYTGGQNLQSQRQAQSDQQDALQAQQDAQAAAVQYQQQQDAQRQTNADRAFGAQQDQQKIDNANTAAQMDLTKDFHKQSADYHNQLIQNSIAKLGQSTDKATADRLTKHYQFLLSQGMAPVDAYTQALIAMHLPGNENGPGQGPQASPQGAATPGQSPFGQAQPDLSQTIPTVQPPTPPAGVGGAANPLQTPQLNYQTPPDNPFNVVDKMQGQVPGAGLSNAPLPGAASKMAQQAAQTDNLQARTETENMMRQPKVQNIISTYADRDKNTAEKQEHDRAIEQLGQQKQATDAAYKQAQVALGQAKLSNGQTTDYKAVSALRGLQGQVDKYDKIATGLNNTISQLQQRKQTISDLYNAPPPPVSNPQALQQWQQIQLTGKGIMAGIDTDIKRHSDELNANTQTAQTWRQLLQQHQTEISGAGAPVKSSSLPGLGGSGSIPQPKNPNTGDRWFDTSAGQLKEWDGNQWGPAKINRPGTVPQGVKPKAPNSGVVYSAPGITVKKK